MQIQSDRRELSLPSSPLLSKCLHSLAEVWSQELHFIFPGRRQDPDYLGHHLLPLCCISRGLDLKHTVAGTVTRHSDVESWCSKQTLTGSSQCHPPLRYLRIILVFRGGKGNELSKRGTWRGRLAHLRTLLRVHSVSKKSC